MRIVLAHKYFYRGGGTATYLFALKRELETRGHECIPFTVAYEQTVPREHWDYYVSPPAGSATTHLADMRLSPWQMLKLLGRATWSMEAYRKALRLVDDLQPDIAYVHNLYSYMSPSPIAAFKKRGVPVIMRVPDANLFCPAMGAFRDGRPCTECIHRGLRHALRFRCHKGAILPTAARVASMYIHRWSGVYNLVDAFVFPSRFLADLMIEAGVDQRKVHHVPSFFVPASRSGPRSEERNHILYFGRVAWEKAIDTLLQAYARVDTELPLVIAGADTDGEEAKLKALCRELGLEDRTRFVGFKQREELDRLIAGAVFSVVPSKWYDNCPMSVLESFAHGTPVIGADIGGIPEQITDEVGLLFEPQNPDDLAAKMQMLLGDPDLRERLGTRARERLRTEYSPDRHCRTLGQLFRSLIDCRPVPGESDNGST